MLFASFGQESSAPAAAAAAAPATTPVITPPVAPSQETRAPFTRPPEATPGFVPRSLQTAFLPEFGPFPSVMQTPLATGLPLGVRNPMRSGPGALTPQADPSGQSSVPASVPSPVKVKAGRMMPPGLIMALGIMPSVRGVRGGHVNPAAIVAAGRKPTTMG
jgi:hypothetical protein